MPKAKTKTATANIRAIVGSDEAKVKREAAELAQKLAPAEAGEFGLEIIDGAADNVEGAATAIRSTIAALQTLPFFGGGKLVWLKSANFLSDDVRGKSANVLEPLEELGDILSRGLPNDVSAGCSQGLRDRLGLVLNPGKKQASTSREGWRGPFRCRLLCPRRT